MDLVCPYCGNRCPPLARVCPHCDVRLDNIRCGGCYSLQEPGSFTCGRCGKALDLDPLLDATSAPCPRCNTPLEAPAGDPGGPASDARLHECPHCGGMFVPREVLADILCRAELNGAFSAPVRPTLPGLDQVRYVPCPLCHASMNRVNFGRVSGVIVDVCREHGTWFDGGELTRVVAFAASGGLARTRAREAEEDEKERAKARRNRSVGPPLLHMQPTSILAPSDLDERIDAWRKLLEDLFWR